MTLGLPVMINIVTLSVEPIDWFPIHCPLKQEPRWHEMRVGIVPSYKQFLRVEFINGMVYTHYVYKEYIHSVPQVFKTQYYIKGSWVHSSCFRRVYTIIQLLRFSFRCYCSQDNIIKGWYHLVFRRVYIEKRDSRHPVLKSSFSHKCTNRRETFLQSHLLRTRGGGNSIKLIVCTATIMATLLITQTPNRTTED